MGASVQKKGLAAMEGLGLVHGVQRNRIIRRSLDVACAAWSGSRNIGCNKHPDGARSLLHVLEVQTGRKGKDVEEKFGGTANPEARFHSHLHGTDIESPRIG